MGALTMNVLYVLKSDIGFYSVVDNLLYDHCFIHRKSTEQTWILLTSGHSGHVNAWTNKLNYSWGLP